jgi:predicted nucleic acid-binding Zn ribbon protein
MSCDVAGAQLDPEHRWSESSDETQSWGNGKGMAVLLLMLLVAILLLFWMFVPFMAE